MCANEKVIKWFPSYKEFNELTISDKNFLVIINKLKSEHAINEFKENIPSEFYVVFSNETTIKVSRKDSIPESYLITLIKSKDNTSVFKIEEDLPF